MAVIFMPGSEGVMDGFDAMAVRIDDEGRVVAGVVFGPKPRATVVARPGFQGCGVEVVDGLARRRNEGVVVLMRRRGCRRAWRDSDDPEVILAGALEIARPGPLVCRDY